jgi:regulator of sigma E protease
VTHIHLDELDTLKNVVQGTVESIDIESKLKIVLESEGGPQVFPVDPQAVMVVRGKETQIAPLDRQFGSKSIGQRALSIFAGPLMNFLLAALLFLIFISLSGVAKNVKLDSVDPNKPAARAGLQAGDVVVSVEGKQVGSDISSFTDMIHQSAEKPMTWVVERNHQNKTLQVVPDNVNGSGVVGVAITSDTRKATVPEALHGTWYMMTNSTKQILIGFKILIFGQFKLDDLGGPVRIVEVTSDYANHGIGSLIGWAGLLSLYLGLFNLLPIPALDGSRLVFLGLEAIRGKPVDPSRESMVHFIGFAMLMLLMIAVTYNDILRLFKG